MLVFSTSSASADATEKLTTISSTGIVGTYTFHGVPGAFASFAVVFSDSQNTRSMGGGESSFDANGTYDLTGLNMEEFIWWPQFTDGLYTLYFFPLWDDWANCERGLGCFNYTFYTRFYRTSGVWTTDQSTTTPVVLVHGFCDGPTAFGQLSTLLDQDAGLEVSNFDYSQYTRNNSPLFSIEQLATIFAKYIQHQKELNGHSVDVVAHSMGGLLARTWIAGLAAPGAPIYNGQIDKLILIGTPNYGARNQTWITLALYLGQLFGYTCNSNQAREMQFGSSLLWNLHDQWMTLNSATTAPIQQPQLLHIAGTGSENPQYECEGSFGCSDGVVDISSATLPGGTVRYVPYRHANIPVFIPPDDGLTIASITDTTHKSYGVIKDFLLTGVIRSQCCGFGTIDYNPPHLRGDPTRQTGFVLLRLEDKSTGKKVVDPQLQTFFVPLAPGEKQEENGSSGAVTFWNVHSGTYQLFILAKGYKLFDQPVSVNVARPTIPPTVLLIPNH